MIAKHEKKISGTTNHYAVSRCEVTATVVYFGGSVGRWPDKRRFSRTSGNDGGVEWLGVASPLAVNRPRGSAPGRISRHCGIKTRAPPSPINSVRRVFQLTDAIQCIVFFLDSFKRSGQWIMIEKESATSVTTS
jgi:hypothetical protein